MARRKKQAAEEGAVGNIPAEDAEAGRILSGMEKAGFREVADIVRTMARAEGKSISEKMAELIQAGLSYEKYKTLNLADLMIAFDFLERLFRNFIYPIMTLSRSLAVETEIERTINLAKKLGFIHITEAERLAAERARAAAEAAARSVEASMAARLQEVEEEKPKGEGPITSFVKKIAETIAERLGEVAIEKMMESGVMDEVADRIVDVVRNAVEATSAEKKHREEPKPRDEGEGGEEEASPEDVIEKIDIDSMIREKGGEEDGGGEEEG